MSTTVVNRTPHGRLASASVISFGTLALMTRTVGPEALAVTLLVGSVGVTGATWRPHAPVHRALLVGFATFALAAVVADASVLDPTRMAWSVAIAAAVGEEAFFRGLAHDMLSARLGQAATVGLTAVLFAAVHLSMYGWGAMPVDLTAGLVLGWQRVVTGSWLVPASTHLWANLLVLTS
jgi:membrane protease YdiL (CAAX protease family)